MDIMSVLTNFLYQLLLTVGVIVLFGSIIALCRRLFCRIIGPSGPKILLITGFIGTPIHELSHAIMCLLFGHKITEMKLYQPNSEDGVLGYVNSSYNPRNLYHQIGNFFIGVAPIICGSGVLLLLMYFLVPELFEVVLANFTFDISVDTLDFSFVGEFFGALLSTTLAMLSFSNMGNVLWWVFIILAFMIATHMEISPADIKTGAIGFAYSAVLLLVADFIISLFSISLLEGVTGVIVGLSAKIVGFLAISTVFSLLMVVVAGITKLLGGIFHR